ncbi:hypothetical protein GAO09_03835 [Rhizobiales bacterium RZME27]|uniref:ABC transporter substrate-binding protein n=1 Tax=Endobacterium cereale TaxID=2663029 RepID=A0A6A8A5R3_9HYPH|nr:hypothetical protein [Endobacterium cereale]MEB2848519.1 hypothetical protein [Endobacterium cereale]MQY45197.1 hypothetical protein [Endobacterium cereale]
MANDKALKPPPTTVEETFGRGSMEITLLLAKSKNGYYEGASRDIRDGAALAVRELDEAGAMKIKVVDVAAGPSSVAGAVSAANGRNSGLLVSFAPQSTTAAIAAIVPEQRPSLINLATSVSGSKVFSFGFDEVASAARGARRVIASGQKKIVVLVPAHLPASEERALETAISQAGGSVTGVIRYDSGTASDLLERNKPLLDAANVALLMGDGAAVGAVLKGLRATSAALQIVGTSHWPMSVYTEPAAANAIIATSDPEAMRSVGVRYEVANKRPFSIHAALGYDSVAITAGIVRSTGATAISPEALISKTGFRGVTGLFRLTAAGAIERRLGVYKVETGRLVSVEAGSESF